MGGSFSIFSRNVSLSKDFEKNFEAYIMKKMLVKICEICVFDC